MKNAILLALLICAGCTKPQDPNTVMPNRIGEPICLPCFESDGRPVSENGFRYRQKWNAGFGVAGGWASATNCIPCAKAKTAEQIFVCTGSHDETVGLTGGTSYTVTVVGGGTWGPFQILHGGGGGGVNQCKGCGLVTYSPPITYVGVGKGFTRTASVATYDDSGNENTGCLNCEIAVNEDGTPRDTRTFWQKIKASFKKWRAQ